MQASLNWMFFPVWSRKLEVLSLLEGTVRASRCSLLLVSLVLWLEAMINLHRVGVSHAEPELMSASSSTWQA